MRELRDAWLPRLADTRRESAPAARAAIGSALGRLGLDHRPGVGLTPDGLPDIDWVAIPGGRFVYQDGERRTCEPFRIARYPVTHARFQTFVDDPDGYPRDRWWKGLTAPGRQPQPARWPIANHPRETVSWHEAMAFCVWLTERLGLGAWGLLIRLPTEPEWERAARGTEGLVYPWGNDYRAGYANIDETWDGAGTHALGQTSPVGLYPQGALPEGVRDLSGNVWECSLNLERAFGSRKDSKIHGKIHSYGERDEMPLRSQDRRLQINRLDELPRDFISLPISAVKLLL
jgi:hypothetical protein